MATNYAMQRKLTRLIHEIEAEVSETCVTRWTPERIAQMYPDGYPEERLRKARQACYTGPNEEWLQL